MEIKDKIYTIRGKQVMLDRDLAHLYGVKIKALNQAVKRNISRFPERFMFQLSDEESENLRSQIVTLEKTNGLSGERRKGRGSHRKYLPYVFTEQGVSMLSAVLKSETAINTSIKIMDAFVVMRKLISENSQIFGRLDKLERKQIEHDKNFEKVFNAIESKDIQPEKGIFFEQQVFDAHKFVSDLINSAKNKIVLIDNYVDYSVLSLFSNTNLDVTIYTKNITRKLKLDLEKYNSQYRPITIREFNSSHDRFLIIDNRDVYHFGASLKDLGKKWFAFSRFDAKAIDILERLR